MPVLFMKSLQCYKPVQDTIIKKCKIPSYKIKIDSFKKNGQYYKINVNIRKLNKY